ncbi:MAG: pyridoxamine 5'-phosphate oxidase family protein [bacterium]|nr:pyridoxamine 5'-phosphate oxidase family protein [bacterium]MDW8087347.1 pyridoxamine 5'-phosphate oxidase family protein [Candidatus Calescibacterium sp.]
MAIQQIETIKSVLSVNIKFFIGAVRDSDGVPFPFLLSDASVDGESITYSVPRNFPAYDLIQKSPETSLSLNDIESVWRWQDPKGFQVKGISKLAGQKFSLEIFEIYDVIPKAGLDLNIPIYRKKLMWIEKPFSARYSFSKDTKDVPASVYNEVKNFREKVHSSGFPSFVLTIDPLNGVPNVSPRWITEMDSKSWVFGDGTRHKTQINAERPCPVSIVFLDPRTNEGYVGVGYVEQSTDPNLKTKTEDYWKSKGFDVKAIKVNVFHPEEIYRFSRFRWEKIYEGRSRSSWLIKS